MPIERSGRAVAMMESGMPGAPVEEEVSVAEEAPVESSPSLPLSILGGQSVAPGDVVKLEVVSVDDESGTFSLRYATDKPKEKKGIESLAAAFE